MKTYNTNPGYEMDPQLLTHFNQHLDSLFGVYSKLLPFRMDFAYRKNTLSYRCACRYAMCAEILRLINEVGEKLVGYAWVPVVRKASWHCRQCHHDYYGERYCTHCHTGHFSEEGVAE